MIDDPAYWHRLQFAFTVTYHYLFPQLTMGLVWFLVFWKWRAIRTGDERYAVAARFWTKILALTFAVGVVTGIPMEFQFGTNWAGFTRYSGGVVGQTLAMEGMFAFLLESAFIGALVWGEQRLGPTKHFLAAVGVAVGSWLSAYFILVTNAFMQHPVGHAVGTDGTLVLADLRAYLLNEWALVQFAHNQAAALVTGTFAVAAVGAFYALRGAHTRPGPPVPAARDHGRPGRRDPGRLSDRRRASQARGALPGAGAGRHGRSIRNRPEGGDHLDRTAERERAPYRQPHHDSRCAQFPRLWHLSQRRTRPGPIPAGGLAGEHRASLLRLPCHGRPGNDLHRADGPGQCSGVSPATRRQSASALDSHARVPVPLHREHRGMDDRRTGAATLARLRVVSNPRGIQRRR